jgi:hypothetical protein
MILAGVYGLRKSVTINKWEAFVRSINNYWRRSLGEPIKPTKHTPFELVMSGEVKPMLRRDILSSNLGVFLFAYGGVLLSVSKDMLTDMLDLDESDEDEGTATNLII